VTEFDRREFLTCCIVSWAATLAPQVGAAADTTASAPPALTAADWQRILRELFPHERVDASLYLPPAESLVAAGRKDAATARLLASVDRAAGVAAIAVSPAFPLLRQTMVFAFYGNPAIWNTFGYDGDAWQQGGYLARGLITIDWLPDPPQ